MMVHPVYRSAVVTVFKSVSILEPVMTATSASLEGGGVLDLTVLTLEKSAFLGSFLCPFHIRGFLLIHGRHAFASFSTSSLLLRSINGRLDVKHI